MHTHTSALLIGGWLSTATPVVADAPPAARLVTAPAPTVEHHGRWARRASAAGAVASASATAPRCSSLRPAIAAIAV
jgi:hypothetical protein